MKRFTAILLAGAMLFAMAGCAPEEEVQPPESEADVDGFRAVSYPSDAVQTLEDRGISLEEFTARAGAYGDYVGNSGYSGSGVVVSPYYTLRVNGEDVPVYAAQVYIGSDGGKGALHSFAVLEITGDPALTAQVEKQNGAPADAVVLPASLGVTPTVSGSAVTIPLKGEGKYTLLVDGASQETALTIFVRKARDEEKEIAEYIAKYGEKRVLVFEPGVHEVDYINVPVGGYVVYLRTGALLIAKHSFDIQSDEDNENTYESNITGQIGTAQKRFPFLNCHNKQDIHITGGGMIDFTALDWHERRGVYMTQVSDLTIEGITLINAPEWTLTAYRCSDVTIRDLIIFGYRTNSDGIAVCNSTNVSVSNCFARSGDDLFEVKGLGGPADAVCSNVTFTDCVAWGGKARCFGVVGEVNLPVSNVTFRDCAILYRDATWDNDRLGGLVVVVEETGAEVSGITFENIEIFRDEGRPINCIFYNGELSGCRITDIVFRNIRYSSPMPLQFKARGQNTIQATLEQIRADGTVITADNMASCILQDEGVSLTLQ